MFKVFVASAMRTRNVLTNFRGKSRFRKSRLPCHNYLKFESYRKILQTNLGLDKTAAAKVLFYQRHIFHIEEERVVKQCQLCQRLYIDPSTLFKNAELLHWRSHILIDRVLLLRELGVLDVQAAMVSNYTAIMSMRMGLFKAYMDIPKTLDVTKNLLECLHKPPPNVHSMVPLDDDATVAEHRKQCMRWYLQWRLEIPKDDEKTLNFLTHNMRNRSFRVVRKLFDALHDDIGLTISEIKRYACLSKGTAEDLHKIIGNIKTFAGVDIKSLIRRHPALHAMEYRSVAVVTKLLHEHGFSIKAMRKYPEILSLDSELVASRLKQIEETPELRVLKNNVNILLVICRFDMVHIRLQYIRYLNIKYPTVRVLTADRRNFKRFIRTGLDKTKSKELGYLLEKSLNLGAKEIIRKIKKHPYWWHVEPTTIHETVTYLLEHFTPQDLFDNIQLVLYPREKVAEVLASLRELSQQSDKSKNFTPKQIVAMCLYQIEYEHHFSGDGVWKYDEAPPRLPKLRQKQQHHEELSDFSDSETAEFEESETESRPDKVERN